METFVAIGLILLIVVVAVTKIIREKKQGSKCIGCPASKSGQCSKK